MRSQRQINRRRLLAMAAGVAAVPVLGKTLTVRAADESVTADENGIFFNPEIIHSISVSFEQADYDAIIDAYATNREKEWLEATVTIDGESYPQSGMRLKGNSSLMGIVGGGGGQMGRGSMGGDASTSAPETLPWLIRLNKFVQGQKHHDLERFVVRSNNSETSLNEAVALDLLAEAGLTSQRAAHIAFSVNGSDPVLRLSIEEPAQEWLDAHFPDGGPLFKSEAEGDWSYRGADPDAYVDVFDLEAGDSGDDAADFALLTSFLDFVNNSDDDTFAADLEGRLDVQRFADYLAMMDLIQNTDDIDGPGNNSYVHFAAADGMATIVPWDMNLAFGGFGPGLNARPGTDQPGQGSGGPFGPNTARPDGATGTPGAFPMPPDGATDDPEAFEFPADATPGGGAFPANGRGGGFGGRTNPLVQRFNANAEFAARYEASTETLRSSLFESGVAGEILDRRAAVLTTYALDLVDQSTITSEAEAIQRSITGV